MVSRNKLILVGLASILVLAQSLYAQKPGTYSVSFYTWGGEQYCDSATVTIGATGFVTGTHVNYDCEGDSTWIDGVTSIPIDKYDYEEYIGPLALLDNVSVLELEGESLSLYLNFSAKTFSYYYQAGGIAPEAYGNSGIIKVSQEEAATSGSSVASWKRSTTSHLVPPLGTLTGYPAGTYEIVIYDSTGSYEYCDFFELTTYDDLVGGLHNLTTGCEEPYDVPIGGNYASLTTPAVVITGPGGSPLGVTGPSLLTMDNEFAIEYGIDGNTTWYFNFSNHFWAVYNTYGTTGLELANWGIFKVIPIDLLSGTTVTHPAGGQFGNPRQQ